MSLGLSPFKAQAELDDLPATPEAIKYLMALVNGSNPEIPPYMALGRLEQMKHEMEKEAPQPPQGTVKDKTMQAAGIMALQGGQQQQAAQQMAQAAPQNMPIPQNVPQPQMQPEEETQMAAGGGLMHARVDSDMFNFAPGGIVSFAGEDQSYVDLDRIRAEAEEASNKLRTYGLRQRKEDPQGYDEAVKRAEEAKAAIRAKEREIAGGPAGAMRQPMGAGPAFVIPQTPDRPPTSTAEVNAVSSIGDLPIGGSAPPPPPPPPSGGPSAGPRPAGNVGIAQALPPELEAMRPKTDPGYQSLLADSRGVADAYGRTVEAQRKKAERPLLESAQEMQLLDKQLGIGRYGEELDKTRTERAKRYEETKKGRSDKIIDSMLDAFVTPGARAGDMSKARSALKQKYEDADEEFSMAQENMMLDVKKYREELAIGNRDKAFALRSDAEKALTTMAGKLAELRLGTFEQAIAYLKHGDNKTMEFNKAVLGFKTHQQDMAQKYSAQRDALKERIKQNQRAYDLRKEQLAFQYAKADVGANKKVLDELASRERMLEVQRDVAMNKGELEKADKFQDQLDGLQSKRANILAPIAGRSEALQGGITSAPGAAASQGKMPAGVTVTRQPS
jgi:hypothetical protein